MGFVPKTCKGRMQSQNRFCVMKYFHVQINICHLVCCKFFETSACAVDDQKSKTNAQTGTGGSVYHFPRCLLTHGSFYSEASRCLKACFNALMIYAAAILKLKCEGFTSVHPSFTFRSWPDKRKYRSGLILITQHLMHVCLFWLRGLCHSLLSPHII